MPRSATGKCQHLPFARADAVYEPSFPPTRPRVRFRSVRPTTRNVCPAGYRPARLIDRSTSTSARRRRRASDTGQLIGETGGGYYIGPTIHRCRPGARVARRSSARSAVIRGGLSTMPSRLTIPTRPDRRHFQPRPPTSAGPARMSGISHQPPHQRGVSICSHSAVSMSGIGRRRPDYSSSSASRGPSRKHAAARLRPSGDVEAS